MAATRAGCGVCRVAEGAQHCGHVGKRWPLQSAFGERASRLSLEVDDADVIAGQEHLLQVVVTMTADSVPVKTGHQQRLEPGEQQLLLLKNVLGVGLRRAREFWDAAAAACAGRCPSGCAPPGRANAGRNE